MNMQVSGRLCQEVWTLDVRTRAAWRAWPKLPQGLAVGSS